MGALRFKPGVKIDRLSIGGACIVAALLQTAAQLPFDLTLTSGNEGPHSGPDDPHPRGDALDVRSHDLADQALKQRVLALVMSALARFDHQSGIVATSGGLASAHFFGFLETPHAANEHFHIQVRQGVTFPPAAKELTV